MKQIVNPVSNGIGSIVNNTYDFQTVKDISKILPEHLFFYNGATASSVANGVLTLSGCSPTGPTVLGIPFNDILASSAFTVDCVSTPTAQVVRLECVKEKCNSVFRVGVSIQRTFDSVSFPYIVPPKAYSIEGEPCEDTTNACLDAVNALIRKINADPERSHNATLFTEGTAPNQIAHLELTAIEAGVNYIISGSENFYPPSTVVLPIATFLTSDNFAALGRSACLPTTGVKCYRAVIFRYRQFLQMDGTITSSSLARQENYEIGNIKTVVFCFDKDVSGEATAAAALLTSLDAGGNVYLSKICPNCSKVTKPFKFCIKRTDAGNDAASATFATDYPALATDFFRSTYTSGVSYYTVQKATSTAPTAVGSDVVVAGDCGPDDVPCTNC